MWCPSADPRTSLEVDIMILDYLAFRATKVCLESRRPQEHDKHTAAGSLRASLQLVDSFTTIFKARHPRYEPDAELRLRLLLLKMTTLFTQRFTLNPSTPDSLSLQELRDANRERAEAWIGGSHDRRPSSRLEPSQFVAALPIATDKLERNRAQVMHQLSLPAEDEDYEDAFYGTTACVSTLDLLPLFVKVSAASSSIHGSNLTERWMRLACEFMLQACLEQYLVYGANGSEVLDEAFAWGYQDGEGAQGDTVPSEVNDMFEDDTFASEVEGWTALKDEYLRELTDFEGHHAMRMSKDAAATANALTELERVATHHPIDAFETSILKFLEALSLSTANPVLAQLERGKLDGMSREETYEFLAQCGVEPRLSS